MSLYTYNGLVSEIAAWCQRSLQDGTFMSEIPTFIALAEQQIFMDCTTLGNQMYVTGTFTSGNGFVVKPSLWGRTLSITYLDSLNISRYVQRQTLEYNELFETSAMLIAPPQYYTDYAFDYIALAPIPDQNYHYRLAYYRKEPPLSSNNQTNWYTINAYDLLFYCSLAKALEFLEDTQRATFFDQKYQERVKMISSYDKERLLDRYADASTKLLSGEN